MPICARVFVICLLLLSLPSFVFAAKTHRLKKNETLYSLTKKYHVSLAELKSANNLVNNQVKPGDTLIIPVRFTAGEPTRATQSTYKIRKGDTLARIAKKPGVSVNDLKLLNSSLGNKRLKPGKILVLKQPGKPRPVPVSALQKECSYGTTTFLMKKTMSRALPTLLINTKQTVELAKNLELKTDGVKMLKNTAYGFLGTRYRFGGNSKSGIDCSSFVQKVFHELEVSLPRTAREQFEMGNAVSPGDLQKGDLIFFQTYASYPSHVGIYLGNNRMIHASSRDRRVVISPMNTPYYRARFLGAKRIQKINPEIFRFDDLIAGIEEESPEETQMNDTLGVAIANSSSFQKSVSKRIRLCRIF